MKQEFEDEERFNLIQEHDLLHSRRINLPNRPIKLHHTDNNSLGIYKSACLTPYIDQNPGKLIPFVLVSGTHTSVSAEAKSVLQHHLTNGLAFIVVQGASFAGKSLFCDKILNLAEVKGNHFSRNCQKGLYLWSCPFSKGQTKIFLVQMSGCGPSDPQYQALSVYVLMIASAIINVRHLEEHKKDYHSLEEMDKVLSNLTQKLAIIPNVIFNLARPGQNKTIKEMIVLRDYKEQMLPNAMNSSYKGKKQDLQRLTFFDTQCYNKDYIMKVSKIFKDVYDELQEKKYNQLQMNGTIGLKVLQYVQIFSNNKKEEFNAQNIYHLVLEKLYNSAFSFCIQRYHKEMEQQLKDEKPKSIDQLTQIFAKVENDTMEQMNQFTLQPQLHRIYQKKLIQYINKKEKKIIQINRLKNNAQVNKLVESIQFTNPKKIKENIQILKKSNLDYCQVLCKNLPSLLKSLQTGEDPSIEKEALELKKKIAAKKKQLELIQAEKNQFLKNQSKQSFQNQVLLKEKKQITEKIKKVKYQLQEREKNLNNQQNLKQKAIILEKKENDLRAQNKIKEQKLKSQGSSLVPEKNSLVTDKQQQLKNIKQANADLQSQIEQLKKLKNVKIIEKDKGLQKSKIKGENTIKNQRLPSKP